MWCPNGQEGPGGEEGPRAGAGVVRSGREPLGAEQTGREAGGPLRVRIERERELRPSWVWEGSGKGRVQVACPILPGSVPGLCVR